MKWMLLVILLPCELLEMFSRALRISEKGESRDATKLAEKCWQWSWFEANVWKCLTASVKNDYDYKARD